jgi:N-methylhydantoinase B/acetone carboxylase, alpha subunit
MIGALNIGERRLLELGERYDFDSVIEGARRLIDYSERRLSAEIAEIPEGTYAADMMVEDDGVGTEPFGVKVKLIIRGGQVIADFTGSTPARWRGP